MKEERFSSGTLSKNKISNFGTIFSFIPKFYIPPSLSLLIWRNERTEKKKDIYVHGLFNSLYIFDTLKVYLFA